MCPPMIDEYKVANASQKKGIKQRVMYIDIWIFIKQHVYALPL